MPTPVTASPLPKRIIAIVAISFGVFLLTVLIIIGIVLFVRRNDSVPSITEADYHTITSGIKFTDATNPKFVYQSPTFNFQQTIDTTVYNYYETSSGIRLYAKAYSDSSGFAIGVQKPYGSSSFDLAKEVASYKTVVTSYSGGTVQSESDIQIDGNVAHKLVTSRPGLSDVVHRTVAVLTVKDNLLYTIEYSVDAATDLKGTEIDAFVSQFKFIDSSKVETVATFSSQVWGLEFTYDSRFWKIDDSGSTSVNLSQRDASVAQTDRADVTINSQEVSRMDLIGKETTYLAQAVAERLGNLQQSTTSYPGFKLTNSAEINLSSHVGKVIEYTTTSQYSFELTNYKEYFFLHNNALTRITVNYGAAGGLGYVQADAVLKTLKFADPTAGQVKGASTQVETAERVAVQAKPAVVRILNITCGDLVIPEVAALDILSGKTYHVCDGGYGSGFFVNSEGYIGTNGHVVDLGTTSLIYASVLDGFSNDLLLNFFKQGYKQSKGTIADLPSDDKILAALAASPADVKSLAMSIITLVSKANLTPEFKTQYYVAHATGTFQVSFDPLSLTNPQDSYTATLVDQDYDPNTSLDKSTQSDVALLKLDHKGDFPTLTLAPKVSVNSGANLVVIGFPGQATDTALTSKGSQSQATVSRGIVSSVKQDASGLHNLIQTDASIDHGSSGGPAIDENMNVVGIATYGLGIAGGNYNFLRDVADLLALMSKNKITNTAGVTQQKWESGLSNFWNGMFSKAITDFQAARNADSDLVDTDSLISVAKDKVAAGLDVAPAGTHSVVIGSLDLSAILSKFNVTELVLIGVVGVMATLVIILVLMMLLRRRPQVSRAFPASAPVVPPQAYAYTAPVAAAAAVVPSFTPAPMPMPSFTPAPTFTPAPVVAPAPILAPAAMPEPMPMPAPLPEPVSMPAPVPVSEQMPTYTPAPMPVSQPEPVAFSGFGATAVDAEPMPFAAAVSQMGAEPIPSFAPAMPAAPAASAQPSNPISA